MKTYIIYRHTLNNKDYIGYSAQTLEERLNDHIQSSIVDMSERHFHRAIRKYGQQNIISEIIDTADTRSEAIEKEKYYIIVYDTFKNGYNMTIGGDGGNTKEKYTEEQMVEFSKIRSELSSGMNNGNARPDATIDSLVSVVSEFVIESDLFNKHISRKQIDALLKEKLDISPRVIVNRIKNHSSLIKLVNENLSKQNLDVVIYDPYYRSDEQRKTLAKEASWFAWVTDGTTSKQVKKSDIDKYLTENTTFRKGRTL